MMMTIEEAIETLQTFSRVRGGDEKESMMMAIKALEKQDQYEKALAFSCEAIKCDVCPVLDCTEEHNAECPEIILAYIKKAYGLEER